MTDRILAYIILLLVASGLFFSSLIVWDISAQAFHFQHNLILSIFVSVLFSGFVVKNLLPEFVKV